jgi:MFS family permease
MFITKSKVKIPPGIWALGFVSLLMDVSSELVHSLLPALFLSLGIGMATVGFIEGAAEAIASITKIFSGALSDWLGKRKILAVVGYGLATITKPLFPLAQSAEVLFVARFIDRIGKGIRGAPRDALIADITPAEIRGEAYGLRQSLDAAGAFIGPLLAIALMALLSDNIGLVLWFALIPALLCMAFLVFGVHEPDAIPAGKDREHKPGFSLRITELTQMGGSFWFITSIGALFAMARFSVAFLALRAMDLGLPIGLSPFVLVLMSIVFSLSSYPVGLLADRIERRYLLALGFATLILAQLLFATATGYLLVMVGVAIWGVHLGLTQGVLAALVADCAPDHLRGSAFGIFNLVNGIALLFASLAAGVLWQMLGAATTFYAGAAFAGIALLLLLNFSHSRHWS